MTDIVTWVLAIGPLLPVLISLVEQPWWSNKARVIVGVLVSALAGVVVYVMENGLTLGSPEEIITAVVGMILAAVTAYRGIWRQLGISKLEEATSPAPRRAAA